MGTSWLQGRVPLIDFGQLSRRCALSRAELLAEDGQRQTAFRYPAGCRGVGEMWSRFAARFPRETFRLGHRVVSIDPVGKEVKTVFGNEETTFPYDLLISTMPLTELCRMSKVAPNVALKYSTVCEEGMHNHLEAIHR